jgi:hypothetical protein
VEQRLAARVLIEHLRFDPGAHELGLIENRRHRIRWPAEPIHHSLWTEPWRGERLEIGSTQARAFRRWGDRKRAHLHPALHARHLNLKHCCWLGKGEK